MSIQDQLKSEKRRLERLKKEPPGPTDLKKRLALAKANGGTRREIQDLEDQIALSEGIGKQTIEQTQSRIAELQAQVDTEAAQQRQAARVKLQAVKEQALRFWLDGGGDHAGFEAAWPQMEQEILMKDTMDVPAEKPKPHILIGI